MVIMNRRLIKSFTFNSFQMKKALLFLPFLALATLFTYCNKSDVSSALRGGAVDQAVADRACGDPCTLKLTADNLNTLNICGVTSNNNPCATCGTVVGTGFVNFTGVGAIQVRACATFYITNPNLSDTYVSFDGGLTFDLIPAGGCVAFTTDGDCNVL
jgi:hypothetical protein